MRIKNKNLIKALLCAVFVTVAVSALNFCFTQKVLAASSWTNGKFDKAYSFDSVSYINLGSVYDGVKTVSFWIKASDVSDKILQLNGTANIELLSGAVTANGLTLPTIYVDGVASATITDTDWHYVAITTDTGINASDVKIGIIDAVNFGGVLDEVKFYSHALSAREIAELYRQKSPSLAQGGTVSDNSAYTALTVQQSGAGDIVNIFDGATEVFTILDGGNVGIGVATPTSKLDIAVADNGNVVGTTITQSDVTNNPNAMNIVNAGTGNALSIDQNGSVGTTTTTDGALFIENTGNTGIGLNAYTNMDAIADAGLVYFTADNTGFDQTVLTIQQDGTGDALTVTSTSTGSIANLTGDSITTGTGLSLSTDGLTTGTGLDITSTSTALTSGKLLSIDWSPTSATTATGDLLSINIGADGTIGNLLNITDNGTSLFSVSESAITMNRPMQVNVAGNTGISYDLNFLNTGLTQITSEGPLMISAGDSNHYENLTLTTGNTGDIVMDVVDSLLGLKVLGSADGGYIMKLSPTGNMDLSQDLAMTGGILTVAELNASDIGTPVGTPSTTGGSMAANIYYYVITALNGNGETMKSTETAAITTTAVDVNSVALSWVPVHGATSYKVYRTTVSDTYTDPAYIANPTDSSYTDIAVSASAGAPPSTNSTGGRIGINIADATPDARIEVLDADSGKPQMRLAQSDNTDYADFEVDAAGDLTITMSGDDLIIDDNLKVCSGACPSAGYTISGTGNLVVENKVVADSFERICADGYIWVPGSAKFGTMPGFCVMKYEAKCSGSLSGATCDDTSDTPVSQEANAPWRYTVSQEEARVDCQRIGTGYHLISENEWMTIAENIANTTINDVDSTAELQLATSHSDNYMTYSSNTGTHTGAIDAAILTDSTKSWTADQWKYFNIYNTTDGSSCYITTNTSNTSTCTLAGGTDNNWDTDDAYRVIGPLPVIAGADPVVSGCVLTSNMEVSPDNDYDSTCEIRGDAVYGEDADDNGFYGTGQAWSGTYSSGGANDAQLRTHVLSNGEVIWDFSGNVYEWTDAIAACTEHPEQIASAGSEWLEYNDATGIDYKGFPYLRPADDGWSSSNGIGKIYTDVGDTANALRAFLRGGDWGGGARAGAFALRLDSSPAYSDTYFGFRCAR